MEVSQRVTSVGSWSPLHGSWVATVRQVGLLGLSLALCFAGWMSLRGYTWVPSAYPLWNPFAIKESGIGRTLARILTEQANTSYHHGLFEQSPASVANPFSLWLDGGTASLGFPGRLKYRPVEQYPLRPYEVKEALDQTEKNLRIAFELDPGNYTAYDVYLFFLTNDVTQTEFASMNGTQLEEAYDSITERGSTQTHELVKSPAGGDANPAVKTTEGVKSQSELSQPPVRSFERWADAERQRRHTRAIEITDEAIRKFRPTTLDPERILTGAVMWYNRFLLLAPEPVERKKSPEARERFDAIGRQTLDKMNYYLRQAKVCQQALERNGLWQTIPERRKEYLQVAQLMNRSVLTLALTLHNNQLQMNTDQLSSAVPNAQ
jgi:hypothetical protein